MFQGTFSLCLRPDDSSFSHGWCNDFSTGSQLILSQLVVFFSHSVVQLLFGHEVKLWLSQLVYIFGCFLISSQKLHNLHYIAFLDPIRKSAQLNPLYLLAQSVIPPLTAPLFPPSLSSWCQISVNGGREGKSALYSFLSIHPCLHVIYELMTKPSVFEWKASVSL